MTWECPLVRKHLSRYFDAELSDRNNARIERHLDNCPSCQRELNRLVETVQFVAHERPVAPPDGGWRNLEAALSRRGMGTGAPVSAWSRPGRANRIPTRPLALAAAALLLLGVAVPLGLRIATPTRALAHEVDLSLLLNDLRQNTFAPGGAFWAVYNVQEVERALASANCPTEYYLPAELPAGFVLKRSMLFKTDCCPGLVLEYTRAEHYLIVVQVSTNHPMHWGDLPCRVVQFDQIPFEVNEHPYLSAVACTNGSVNLFVAGNIESHLLGEVASHLHAGIEAASETLALEVPRR